MEDDPSSKSSESPDVSPGAMLGFKERSLALVLGVTTGTSGTIAVFVSENQAGTAALFIVSAALLLMAVQGTPLTRFGSGEHSVEFVRRQLGRELIQQGRLEESAEAARAYVEAASIVEPSIGGNSSITGLQYETTVGEALTRLSDSPVRRGVFDRNVDFFVRYENTTIGVIVKCTQNPVSLGVLQHLVDKVENRVSPIAIVVDKASSRALDQFPNWLDESKRPNVRLVEWHSADDDHALQSALADLAGTI
ncbi:hypothetical protein AB0N05_14940 [Nocardia sp. NPDC051030]|uniref:hypothetical protein n=1 Tax=Nocardia sp. NPDC051030 TaxID=3155162 RepID=UPI00341DFA60